MIKPGLDVVVGCTYFMALITLSLFFRRRVGGGVGRGRTELFSHVRS